MKIKLTGKNFIYTESNEITVRKRLARSLGHFTEASDEMTLKVTNTQSGVGAKSEGKYEMIATLTSLSYGTRIYKIKNSHFFNGISELAEKIERDLKKEKEKKVRYRKKDGRSSRKPVEKEVAKEVVADEVWQLQSISEEEARIQMTAHERNFYVFLSEDGTPSVYYRKLNGDIKLVNLEFK